MNTRIIWIVAGSVAFAALLLDSPATAQVRQFDIPSQNAEKSVLEFARQANIQVLAPGDQLQGIITPEIKGAYDVFVALELMLKGTDLKASRSPEGIMMIYLPAEVQNQEREDMSHNLKASSSLLALLLGSIASASAQETPAVETITVTGYRASLTSSTNAKRAAVGFSDSIFAEDIGKFPDTNIAEAFNRIPGVTIRREVTGEGLQIAIRGLGTNFTRVLLNNAPVAIASTGQTDAQSTNREVDLNMFPTELFTQLTVSKSPTADMVEGGAAGTVTMRSMRPFDNPGFHVTYNAKAQMGSVAGKVGENGTLIVSDTEGPFGVLIGLTLNHNLVKTEGIETIGWGYPSLTPAQCGSYANCNSNSKGGWTTIPSTVPNDPSVIAAGVTPGETIDAAWLQAHNPGLSIAQINNALMPSLLRPAEQYGHRDRANAIVSLEYRPSDYLHFYLDFIGGRIVNNERRIDAMFLAGGWSGQMFPLNETVDANGVVTSGIFPNSTFFLEDRPYTEKESFISFNPGVAWQPTELLKVDLQANATRSHFFRDYPTIGLFTGTTIVTFSNTPDAKHPSFETPMNLQDPANWKYDAGQRAYVQQEKRYTYTNGVHLDVTYGGDEMSVRAGGAFDDVYRSITPRDNSNAWQAAVCGGNPSVYLPAPNSQPYCDGIAATHPAYPGYGTGYSSGFAPITWQGSLVPQSDLAKYLIPGPQGYAIIDWPKFRQASHYDQFAESAPFNPYSNTGARAGTIDEKSVALYGELNGVMYLGDSSLNYNVGMRWVQTLQSVSGPVQIQDPRNATLSDGGLYPAQTIFPVIKNTYQAFLPALNVVYHATDNVQLRFAASRTMTRPNPDSMVPGVNFSDPSASLAQLGNSELKPYFSNNLDLGVEVFTGGEGYVGATAFRKSLSGFTVNGLTLHPFSDLAVYGFTYDVLTQTQKQGLDGRGGPSAAMVTFQQQVNAQGLLIVNGLEFSWVQPLDFLLEQYGLKGFGFTANATVVDQKATGSAEAVATGVSPYTYNLVGYYESDGAMLRVSYVYNDKQQITGFNQGGIPAAAVYANGYGQMDLSASYRLSKLLGEIPSDPEITFDMQNVLDASSRTYFMYKSASFTYYEPGRVFLLGIRGTF